MKLSRAWSRTPPGASCELMVLLQGVNDSCVCLRQTVLVLHCWSRPEHRLGGVKEGFTFDRVLLFTGIMFRTSCRLRCHFLTLLQTDLQLKIL